MGRGRVDVIATVRRRRPSVGDDDKGLADYGEGKLGRGVYP
jgi:hypothetical protein